MNPIPELASHINAEIIIKKRVLEFSRLLNIDVNRIKNWCFVKGVLCAIWALEDGLDPNYFIANKLITLD
jgi:streptomycin 6-kinase